MAATTTTAADRRRAMPRDAAGPPARAPSARPPFTVKDLRRAVPPECFVRSLPRSLTHLAADLTLVAALFALSTQIPRAVDFLAPPASAEQAAATSDLAALAYSALRLALGAALWMSYWFFQGAHCTGLWVTAHECGHGAFSDFPLVNDAVGYAIHTALLVPYYSWKHSHRRHHSNTGSAERDEVFVPAFSAEDRPLWASGLYRLGHLLFQQLLGWPCYLLFNASGRDYSGRWASHFDPWSPVFGARERAEVALSTAGVAAAASLLWSASQAYGPSAVLKTYLVPYLCVNWWLVMITFLQHTHPALPHYTEGEWDWLRGALSTVDRSFGGYLDGAFHHIADTHVAHHLFSSIPHYHARRATEAVKGVLGEYYMRDDRSVWRALWEDTRDCHYAAPDEDGDEAAAGGGKEEGGEQQQEQQQQQQPKAVRRGVLWYRSVRADDKAAAAAKAA